MPSVRASRALPLLSVAAFFSALACQSDAQGSRWRVGLGGSYGWTTVRDGGGIDRNQHGTHAGGRIELLRALPALPSIEAGVRTVVRRQRTNGIDYRFQAGAFPESHMSARATEVLVEALVRGYWGSPEGVRPYGEFFLGWGHAEGEVMPDNQPRSHAGFLGFTGVRVNENQDGITAGFGLGLQCALTRSLATNAGLEVRWSDLGTGVVGDPDSTDLGLVVGLSATF